MSKAAHPEFEWRSQALGRETGVFWPMRLLPKTTWGDECCPGALKPDPPPSYHVSPAKSDQFLGLSFPLVS